MAPNLSGNKSVVFFIQVFGIFEHKILQNMLNIIILIDFDTRFVYNKDHFGTVPQLVFFLKYQQVTQHSDGCGIFAAETSSRSKK
jgi:hypothetical protein